MEPRKKIRIALALLSVILLSCACRGTNGAKQAAADVAPGASRDIRRTLVGRHPAQQAGWETRLYRIEYPGGAAAPLHEHPAPGVGLIVEGTAESAFADDPVATVRSGEGFVDRAGVPHRVFRNASPDQPLRFVVAYTIRVEDEPLRLLGAPDHLRSPRSCDAAGSRASASEK